MTKKHKHIIFYDGECGFCDQTVQLILKVDNNKKFVFASLQGETASKFLKNWPSDLKDVDSIILVEDFEETSHKVYILSRAVFKICWLLGGPWTMLGLCYFLPACLFDWVYRLVARFRRRILPQRCFIPIGDQKKRFLP